MYKLVAICARHAHLIAMYAKMLAFVLLVIRAIFSVVAHVHCLTVVAYHHSARNALTQESANNVHLENMLILQQASVCKVRVYYV